MFAGRYENASDKRDCVSAPARIRADCGLDFADGGGREKIRLPDSRREIIAIPIKKIQENIVPENHREKRTLKHRKEKTGVKKNRKPDARTELFPGKSVHSIPLLQMRLFQGA